MTSRRRVVTGHTDNGTSTIASDAAVPARTSPGLPGVDMLYLWGTDGPQAYPDQGAEPAWTQHFPPVGGFRFVTFTLPPADFVRPEDADSPENQQHARSSFPGLLETYREDEPGVHTSDTTDVAVVLSGEVVLGLSDGTETTLAAGDTVVQNGTAHSWTNRTNQPVEMLFVLVGATRKA
ncbi:cupin domain-containing protein [Aeromicrobium endophyticum]|uniref:Cupin domain-containing protein n=1 Tax=Aeromicrobium endophyticum TaxID=2292704 RepID=A0A371PBK8_9ACTN|nr:cupin domain-containing protein [Aeromicrobium endophyticum]REK72956.1 cupin domain-containing protein [Aeromicrobium endophyticum]